MSLERLEKITLWFEKLDKKRKKAIVAGINAEYETWSNFLPITILTNPFITIFFTFFSTLFFSFITLSVTLSNNIGETTDSQNVRKDMEKAIDDLFHIFTSNGFDFFQILGVALFGCLLLVVYYYWKLNRVSKLKNILNLCYEENEKDK